MTQEAHGGTDAAPWQDPSQASPQDDAPTLSAGDFTGPLDCFLEMVRARKIDLTKLPIAELIASFADAMEAAFGEAQTRSPHLDRWGEWVVMAATLLQLRSGLLLPKDAPEAKAALSEAERLQLALVARAQMRAGADWLEQRPRLGRNVFGRGRPNMVAGQRSADLTDLLRACLTLLKVPEALIEAWRPLPPAYWSVGEAMAHAERLLGVLPSQSKWERFLPTVRADHPRREQMCREAVCSTFAASLELARAGNLTLEQAVPWTSMLVTQTGQQAAADAG